MVNSASKTSKKETTSKSNGKSIKKATVHHRPIPKKETKKSKKDEKKLIKKGQIDNSDNEEESKSSKSTKKLVDQNRSIVHNKETKITKKDEKTLIKREQIDDSDNEEESKSSKSTKKLVDQNRSIVHNKETKITKKDEKTLIKREQIDDSDNEESQNIIKKIKSTKTNQTTDGSEKKQLKVLKKGLKSKEHHKAVQKSDNKILEVKTTQTAAFKQAIERISNVLSDCSIVFVQPDKSLKQTECDDYYEEIECDRDHKIDGEVNDSDGDNVTRKQGTKNKNKNTGGIRILRLTEDKSVLIKVSLHSFNFEIFRCEEPKIIIGVDMHNFHTLLKMVNDDDPIVFYMNRDNRSVLYIRSSGDKESGEETYIELFLIDVENPEMPIPQTVFQNKIMMASEKFHGICKHLNGNSTHVEITSVNNQISFRGQNEGGRVTMSYRDTNPKKKRDKHDKDQIVQGVFELRSLMCFSKCNKLCNTIEIYLKNDFPLVLIIAIAKLGKMYVFLSPAEIGDQ